MSAHRSRVVLIENLEHLMRKFGRTRLVLITLTLLYHLAFSSKADRAEAARLFDDFRRRFLVRFGLAIWFAVIEPQHQDRIHWHILVVFSQNLSAAPHGFDSTRSADAGVCENLQRWKRELRQACRECALGRSSLEPVRSSARALGRYLTKSFDCELALPEGVAPEDLRHIRRVRYSHGWRVANSTFAAVHGRGRLWRLAVKAVAKELCRLGIPVNALPDFAEHFGRRWAYHFGDKIRAVADHLEVSLPQDVKDDAVPAHLNPTEALCADDISAVGLSPRDAARLMARQLHGLEP